MCETLRSQATLATFGRLRQNLSATVSMAD
ncbi:hypothetical protein G9444_4255 [Rhodococcus erythropolis]|uniref:Uncharacterized protein n=1 Tax=Rhodococcus erythropolis TaxID=1833 RepID=A0A6G9CX65_RHOER|nr:hypothetical protein G9444_4255 [Rhodococcus erythropolis]